MFSITTIQVKNNETVRCKKKHNPALCLTICTASQSCR